MLGRALLFLFAVAGLGAADFSADDRKAVVDLVDRYAAARENRDPKAIETLFTEDADQLVSSGVWRKGRDTLVQGMLESSRRNSGERTITVETVRPLTANAAVADARYVIAASGDRPERRMWSTFLAVRTGAGWRIAAIRNMKPAE